MKVTLILDLALTMIPDISRCSISHAKSHLGSRTQLEDCRKIGGLAEITFNSPVDPKSPRNINCCLPTSGHAIISSLDSSIMHHDRAWESGPASILVRKRSRRIRNGACQAPRHNHAIETCVGDAAIGMVNISNAPRRFCVGKLLHVPLTCHTIAIAVTTWTETRLAEPCG